MRNVLGLQRLVGMKYSPFKTEVFVRQVRVRTQRFKFTDQRRIAEMDEEDNGQAMFIFLMVSA